MTNVDTILKSRGITLPTKVHLAKAMVFPVAIHGCECCNIKKTEHQRTIAFELWCWKKLLKVPWTARRSNQPVPKGNQFWLFIGSSNTEAEVPILWPPDVKSWLIGKDPDAGKDWRQDEGDDRGWNGWMASLTQGAWVWTISGRWWWIGKPGMLWSMGSQRVRHDWAPNNQKTANSSNSNL